MDMHPSLATKHPSSTKRVSQDAKVTLPKSEAYLGRKHSQDSKTYTCMGEKSFISGSSYTKAVVRGSRRLYRDVTQV